MGRQPITWKMIDNQVDLIRVSQMPTLQALREKLNGQGRNFLKVVYQPGLGGSTFLRRLAFELHGEYPTLMVNRYLSNITANAIRKVYERCRFTLLVLVDCNYVLYDDAKKLFQELRSESIPFTLVYLLRATSLGVHSDLPRLERLSKKSGECNSMRTLLLPHIAADTLEGRMCLDNLNRCLQKPDRDEEHSPFVLSMYAFDYEFKGIQPFISHTINEIALLPEKETYMSILFILALADWAGTSVDANYFNVAFHLTQTKMMRRPDYIMSPLISSEEDREPVSNCAFASVIIYTANICFDTFPVKQTIFLSLGLRLVFLTLLLNLVGTTIKSKTALSSI